MIVSAWYTIFERPFPGTNNLGDGSDHTISFTVGLVTVTVKSTQLHVLKLKYEKGILVQVVGF